MVTLTNCVPYCDHWPVHTLTRVTLYRWAYATLLRLSSANAERKQLRETWHSAGDRFQAPSERLTCHRRERGSQLTLNINKRAIVEYPSWYCCWWSAGQTAEIASLHFVSLEQWIQWKWVWGKGKVRWTINWSASVTWHGSSSRTLADRSFLLSTSRRVCTYQLAVGLNTVHHTAPPKTLHRPS